MLAATATTPKKGEVLWECTRLTPSALMSRCYSVERWRSHSKMRERVPQWCTTAALKLMDLKVENSAT